MNCVPFYLHIPVDEVPYSTITRFALLAGLRTPLVMKDIFGTPRKRVHPYLPGKLQMFADFFELSVDEVIQNRTILPLFRLSQPSDVDSIRCAMKEKSDDKVLLRTAIAHSRFRVFYGLNFCPVCAQRDIKEVGFAYWHISHQIPGVMACSEHRCLLIPVPMGDGHKDRTLSLPPFSMIQSIQASSADIRFADFATQLVDFCRHHSINYKKSYRYLLERKGMLSSNGKCAAISQVVEELIHFWNGIKFTRHTEPGIPDAIRGFGYVARILRTKTHSKAHPLKHILLACWLADCKVSNLVVSDTETSNQVEPKGYVKTQENIESTVLGLLKKGDSFNCIESKTGKSRCYIKRISELNKINHQSNSMAFPESIRRQVLIKAFYGIHREEIASLLSVSVGYVEQVISSEPMMSEWRKHLRIRKHVLSAYRELETIRKANPLWCRTRVRKNAQSAYFTLYNNDKSLIDKVMPQKTRPSTPPKNWQEEDERILQILKGLNDLCAMSLCEIGRRVNDHGNLRRRISKLPKSAMFLAKHGKLKKHQINLTIRGKHYD